ncbi:alkaline phosphatase [Marinobacterium nitratireducens]|uniref:Alkaline phosphatase n=1 Tax=Marinobacterium nitratireducens TaxID=518897 RepID=A0A918DSB2_9GAMM|nr:esterase-like activity of phytase family protein [Marinobacterium nitratireducens]GGO80400.1 alkaline phosphatase [Marinobacterium nitratireducens]
MTRNKLSTIIAGLLLTTGAGGAGLAVAKDHGDMSFQRVSTLANYLNNGEAIDQETVSEIVAATRDGMTVVYTDSPLEQIGFVDITDPAMPQPAGTLALNGEPTSVDVVTVGQGRDKKEYALVAVNTSADYVNVSGELVVVDIASQAVAATLDLGGQPDSIKVSPDGRYVAIAIENERDEDIEVNDIEGGLPQFPAGYLAIVDIVGDSPADWSRRDVDLSGLAAYGGDDPEPEFVDVNRDNLAAVSLQENNHLAIVDLKSGEVRSHFDLGTVDLEGVDAHEDDIISLGDDLAAVPREPDAIAWLKGKQGEWVIATANEGDLFGGSRGFSIFTQNGDLLFDSGSSFEEIAVRHGHYPESRSENKGSEPEAIEQGTFGDDDYLFVGSERGSFVAVYRMEAGEPEFSQLLPAPFGPEGVLAIPQRNLLIASGEEDDPSFGVRSSIMVYELKKGAPAYSQIVSADVDGKPIGWSALSGMTAVPGEKNSLLAVWDSYYSESRIFSIDTSAQPALITGATTISGGTGNYDPEGIAIAPDGSRWVASEGNASDSRPNRLLHLDENGAVLSEIGLPQEILDCRAASGETGTLGSGFEGVAVVPGNDGDYSLLVAQQRGWDYTTAACDALDDDAGGLNANGQPNRTRLWTYDPQSGDWGHIAWELAALPENASWVGLSEVTRAPDGSLVVIERDNRTGDFAQLKTLVRVEPSALEDGIVTADEKQVYNLLPAMQESRGWISDKPEGVAITENGKAFVVTDNDGVDDWSGETSFLELGPFKKLFR